MRLIAEAQVEALSELHERYGRLIFSVAYATISNRDIAEEITLDVLTRVWQNAGRYRADEARVSTWLTAITRHHAIDVLRRLNSRPEQSSLSWDEVSHIADRQAALVADDPQETAELLMQQAQVRAAVGQLPPEQKQVLMLAYFKGYTQRQIAEALGQPLGTVKTRIRLALQKLRDILQDDRLSEDKSETTSDA
ncbi:MAG: RNA polymerase sigma factor [Anaerolineales bacterium]